MKSGTFKSDISGTFVSDTSGTFGVIYSTFDCTKVKFKIKSRSPKETIEGYGYEWYAPNIGVVRTEQYNNNNVLQSYSVLEEVK